MHKKYTFQPLSVYFSWCRGDDGIWFRMTTEFLELDIPRSRFEECAHHACSLTFYSAIFTPEDGTPAYTTYFQRNDAMSDHLRFMNRAYQEALRALDEGEVPIGAIIVRDEQIIGRGYNRIEQLSDATAHAEIIAISAASNSSASWRLNGCTLYVTLEPCLMCLGAIMQSRIETIIYGATDPRFGAIDTRSYRTGIEQSYRWFPTVVAGILKEECSALISTFFSELRKKN